MSEERLQENVVSTAEDVKSVRDAVEKLNAMFESSDFSVELIRELKKSAYIWREVHDRARGIVVELSEKNMELDTAEKSSVALGVVQWILGHFAEAVENFLVARKTVFVEYMLGLCQKERGAFTDAAKVLAHAHDKKPDDADVGLLLAQVQALTGEIDDAVKTLKGFKSLKTTDADYARAFIAEMSGEYEKAEALYKAVIEKNPSHTESLFRLALNYDLGGYDLEAIEYYRRCLEIKPGYTGAVLNLGLLLEDSGRDEEAARYYQRVLIDEPNNPRAKLYMRDAEAGKEMYYDEEKERKADKHNRVLETPVTDFELSVRSRNCLDLMGIHSLGDLINVTEAELLSYKNFGETSLSEIKSLLVTKGLRLGQGLEEPKAPVEPVEEVKPKSPSTREAFGKSVSDLDLTREQMVKLQRIGVDTLGELQHFSAARLVTYGVFDKREITELTEKLAEKKLALKQ